METLLEDYKRRLKTVTELIEKKRSNGSIVHQRREERLNTKAAEYRAFIIEIERAMARQKHTKNANCAIFDVNNLAKLAEFVKQQKDLPPEINDIVNDNFWDLI